MSCRDSQILKASILSPRNVRRGMGELDAKSATATPLGRGEAVRECSARVKPAERGFARSTLPLSPVFEEKL